MYFSCNIDASDWTITESTEQEDNNKLYFGNS